MRAVIIPNERVKEVRNTILGHRAAEWWTGVWGFAFSAEAQAPTWRSGRGGQRGGRPIWPALGPSPGEPQVDQELQRPADTSGPGIARACSSSRFLASWDRRVRPFLPPPSKPILPILTGTAGSVASCSQESTRQGCLSQGSSLAQAGGLTWSLDARPAGSDSHHPSLLLFLL